MAFHGYSAFSALIIKPLCLLLSYAVALSVHAYIPSTLDGPFQPVTVPFDASLRGNAVDLPDTDPRVRRSVKGFEPEQISVSLSFSYDSVWISWITGEFQIGYNIKPLDPKQVASIVHFGGLRYPLSHEAKGYSLVYNQLYPFEGLQNYTSGIIHHVRLTETPIHETYQPRWDYWGRYMQQLVSQVPIMVVEGNHEIEEQAGNQTFVAYSSRFAFPSIESGSSSTFYYSFDAGGIHFVMLGAYIDYEKSGDQYKWLEKDLANVNRDLTPWLIVSWHPPWYSSYSAHYREAECMRVAMEELLYSYGVDIVFNGHVHAYERSNRVYNYKLDPCGPVYITVGDGGNREKMAIEHADEPGHCPEPSSTPDPYMGGFCAENFTTGPAAGKFCWDQQPDYSAFRESSFGHGILEVKNESWALWTWHRNQDSSSKIADQIYIVRQPHKCPFRCHAHTLTQHRYADI
ncbi:purple acid phosphatase 15 isoform X3 [Euphorbia lathyris]|uniref:purple acid phosphatase 15 isoform X3 n=1 Tax=Euphorbia lathyris TaxID=212925 RepID=UPI003313AC3D